MSIQTAYTDFSQIPRFIEGNDVVDIPLSGIQRQLDEYRKFYGLDMEPDFQRAHVWTQDQQAAFVEHVLRGGRKHRDPVELYRLVPEHQERGPGPTGGRQAETHRRTRLHIQPGARLRNKIHGLHRKT